MNLTEGHQAVKLTARSFKQAYRSFAKHALLCEWNMCLLTAVVAIVGALVRARKGMALKTVAQQETSTIEYLPFDAAWRREVSGLAISIFRMLLSVSVSLAVVAGARFDAT